VFEKDLKDMKGIVKELGVMKIPLQPDERSMKKIK